MMGNYCGGGMCGGCGDCGDRKLTSAQEIAVLEMKEKMLEAKLKLIRDMKESLKSEKAAMK